MGTANSFASPDLSSATEPPAEPENSSWNRVIRSGTLSPYATTVRNLSQRVVQAQRPLRILEALKWDDGIEESFFAAGARQLPPVSRDYYQLRPLSFDPANKRMELLGIERDIRRLLGRFNPAGQILLRMCEEYRQVVDLLEQRGTPTFSALSERLYGSASESCHAGGPTLADVGRRLGSLFEALADSSLLDPLDDLPDPDEVPMSADEAASILQDRLERFFGPNVVRVRLSDRITADAAAEGDCLKLRSDAQFTPREVRMLEVHEGWVHLGTTMNGLAQPVCTFLSKLAPSATVTQEGLAVLTEVLALACHPARARRLAHRVEGVALAEAGADFLEVYRFFLEQGYPPSASYQHSMRIFRGSLPAGCGPFTKDLSYSKGFVLLLGFLRQAVVRHQTKRMSLLFCGKTNLADIRLLGQLADEGLLVLPQHLPPVFSNMDRLGEWTGGNAWTAFSQHFVDDLAGLF